MANQRGHGNYRNLRQKQYHGNKEEEIEKPKNEWITHGINTEAIDWASKAGKHFKRMTTSQIRKFFGEVRRIQGGLDKYSSDIPMLRAQLAYAAGRNGSVKSFQKTFDPLLIEVGQDKDKFNNFVKLLEATVAYHKYFGGNE